MVLPQENSLLRKAIAQKEIKKPSEESFYTEEIVYTLSKIIKEYFSSL